MLRPANQELSQFRVDLAPEAVTQSVEAILVQNGHLVASHAAVVDLEPDEGQGVPPGLERRPV